MIWEVGGEIRLLPTSIETPELLVGIFRAIYHFLSILSLEKNFFKSILCKHYPS